jgi:exopolysaccharide production protein ExoZ
MHDNSATVPAALASRLDLVQSLRGLAAFGVLTHHIAVAIDRFFGDQFTPPGIGLGWAGVDLFFVLSGFIMVWTTRDGGHGLRTAGAFWARRALRVYPPYWVATAIALALTLSVPALAQINSGAGWIESILLWPAAEQPFLNPGWTLIYELWFYLGFGFLILAPRRFLPMLLAGWAFAVIVAALRFGETANPVLHVVINPLTLDFLMGAFVAMALGAWRRTVSAAVVLGLAAIGAAALLAGVLYVTATGWNDWTRMAACGPACAILLTAAVLADRAGLFRPHRALIVLGDWSYALYLTHQPIIFAAAILCAQVFGISWTGVAIAAVIGLILPFPVTWALHKFVEMPAQGWGRSLARRIKP